MVAIFFSGGRKMSNNSNEGRKIEANIKRLDSLFNRVQQYSTYVRNNMEKWEGEIDLEEPV